MKRSSVISLLLCLVMVLCGCTFQTQPAVTSTTVSLEESSVGSTIASAPLDTPQEQEPVNSSINEEDTQKTSSAQSNSAFQFSFSQIPTYTGNPYVVLNGGQPIFSENELTSIGKEQYSSLDSLGRCGVAFAVCGREIMPKQGEERGSISHIKPSGWKQAQYDCVKGKYLYNRCHLLGWQLSAENDNNRNLITGTRYMNTEGMLPFENMIADYIKETNNHVAYRVTPRFEGNNLLASGVQLEAYSIEDEGESICFHVYVYNLQPGVSINYKDGSSKLTQTTSAVSSYTTTSKVTSKETTEQSGSSLTVYITPTGKRYHLIASCGGKNSSATTLNNAKALGLTPCKKCAS